MFVWSALLTKAFKSLILESYIIHPWYEMKKIVIEKAGNYDELKLEEFPNPKPGKGEILIATYAIGVNFADCLVRMGYYRSAKDFIGWPITPGFEISGIVKEVGEGVTQFTPGQKVIAITLFGGYTTHLVVSEDQVFLLPAELDFTHGAGLPAVFLTAYYALFELAYAKMGNWILIHSAAGGVGSTLVQFAKLAGCNVVGVVGGAHKVDYVKSLGADVVIDKSSEDLWKKARQTCPEGYDIILDANGVETLRQGYKHLSIGGKLVVYGFHTMFSKGRGRPNIFKLFWDYFRTPRFNPINMTSDNHSVLAFNLSYLFKKKKLLREDMNTMLRWIQEGKVIRPNVKTYPLEKVSKAHRDLESGNTIGKLILTVDE
jgi:synaptic vesicle membrane protein VAT-1